MSLTTLCIDAQGGVYWGGYRSNFWNGVIDWA